MYTKATQTMADMFSSLRVTFLVIWGIIGTGRCCCPDAWQTYRGSCYLFHEDHMSWTEAAHYCELLKAHLAVVESKIENNFLRSFATRLFRSADVRHHTAFWLGATDDLVEGNWVWYINNQDLTYFEWASQQPDTTPGNREDCLALNGAYDFSWSDGQCGEKVAFPLCEKKSFIDTHTGQTLIG